MDLLTLSTVALNLIMGAVYVAYGLVTLHDLRRQRASRGGSHLAYGFMAIMFTCGPHHIDHGLHLATGGGPAGGLDLAVVALGLPAGLTWFLLRIEALRGGRGDRVIASDMVIDGLRTGMATAAVLVTATVLAFDVPGPGWSGQIFSFRLLPNLLIMGLYIVIAVVLLRTQLARHTVSGTWSLSGICLTLVFATCAGMHAAWAGYVASGAYTPDTHLLLIDLIAVPATMYFLGVIWLLSEGRLPDWTEASGDVTKPGGMEAAELDDMLV